jgi:hypothetical protein
MTLAIPMGEGGRLMSRLHVEWLTPNRKPQTCRAVVKSRELRLFRFSMCPIVRPGPLNERLV